MSDIYRKLTVKTRVCNSKVRIDHMGNFVLLKTPLGYYNIYIRQNIIFAEFSFVIEFLWTSIPGYIIFLLIGVTSYEFYYYSHSNVSLVLFQICVFQGIGTRFFESHTYTILKNEYNR
jgi:hypothetical protein